MILVFGVAGSGKSTQSQLLANRFGWMWLSMGEMLREELKGSMADQMNSDKMLNDEQVMQILQKNLNSIPANKIIILDGFPRRQSQAEWLVDTLANSTRKIDVAVHLEAQQVTVQERLLSRGRQDDIPDAIKERFHEYDTQIKPILNYLEDINVPLINVDAEQSPNKVHSDIVDQLKELGVVS